MNKQKMKNRSYRIGQYVVLLVTGLGAIFWGVWIPILTNWLSQISANWLKIETSTGTWLVIALSIATLLMYIFQIFISNAIGNIPPDGATLGGLEIQAVLQGSIFTLAIAMSLICRGFFSKPFSFTKILQFAFIFLPMVQSLASKRTIVKRVEEFSDTLMSFIDVQLKEPLHLVTQRMIESKIREFENRQLPNQTRLIGLFKFTDEDLERLKIKPKPLPSEKISSLARFFMKVYLEKIEFSKHPHERIVLDSFREPENWKIRLG